ncbi:LysE family translocator [Citromicrobium bathyomarinum]|uniref:LysE family translocator n=1 Tax=Citromicrobium bathyomarinum TaxID=72174 RepID=UPI001E6384AC|nr:LysE family translocator [Citromicrobium bathyomarinum]
MAHMTFDLLPALAGFALVSSITPGPNNVMVMASGANFGMRRTVPHILGIGCGFVVMLLLVGLGLARLFEMFPVIRLVLTVVSALYLLWLAWKIANAAPVGSNSGRGRPFTFLQAALFQWVNPKAWMMALSAITLYAPGDSTGALMLVAAVFGIVNLPCVSAWAGLGTQAARWLSNPARLRAFNYTMAACLLATLAPVLVAEFVR